LETSAQVDVDGDANDNDIADKNYHGEFMEIIV
jgi:hypothetical protein